ncbi:cytochrome B6, partial [Acidianus sp. DSM 29099]|nr:cytochrome B6 [Acidianus sp. RZ1]
MKLYPKSELGFSLLFTGATIAWLAVLGSAMLGFRTILLTPHLVPGPNYSPASLYYFLVTMHGQVGMMIVVEDLTLAVFAYALYKAKMGIIHKKTMMIAFLLLNIPMIFYFAGGPLMGWYMYPP